jgi:hypothetical protein
LEIARERKLIFSRIGDITKLRIVLILDPNNELIKEYEPVLVERIKQLEECETEEADSGNESETSEDEEADNTSSSDESSSNEEDT